MTPHENQIDTKDDQFIERYWRWGLLVVAAGILYAMLSGCATKSVPKPTPEQLQRAATIRVASKSFLAPAAIEALPPIWHSNGCAFYSIGGKTYGPVCPKSPAQSFRLDFGTIATGTVLSCTNLTRPAWKLYSKVTNTASLTVAKDAATRLFRVTNALCGTVLHWQPVQGAASYSAYIGSPAGIYTRQIDTGTTNCVITGLVPGDYGFAVTATTASGHESNFSPAVRHLEMNLTIKGGA